jgi:hypothetical protein
MMGSRSRRGTSGASEAALGLAFSPKYTALFRSAIGHCQPTERASSAGQAWCKTALVRLLSCCDQRQWITPSMNTCHGTLRTFEQLAQALHGLRKVRHRRPGHPLVMNHSRSGKWGHPIPSITSTARAKSPSGRTSTPVQLPQFPSHLGQRQLGSGYLRSRSSRHVHHSGFIPQGLTSKPFPLAAARLQVGELSCAMQGPVSMSCQGFVWYHLCRASYLCCSKLLS